MSDVFRHRSGTEKSYCRTRSNVGSERVKWWTLQLPLKYWYTSLWIQSHPRRWWPWHWNLFHVHMVNLLSGCYCFIPEFQDLPIITQNNERYCILCRQLNITPYQHHSYTKSIMLYLRFSQQWRWSLLSCDVTLLSASEECSTSTSSMPANSNSCLSNIHLNSSFIKMGLNWPVFEGYPVKQQIEVYKNGPENNRIQ